MDLESSEIKKLNWLPIIRECSLPSNWTPRKFASRILASPDNVRKPEGAKS